MKEQKNMNKKELKISSKNERLIKEKIQKDINYIKYSNGKGINIKLKEINIKNKENLCKKCNLYIHELLNDKKIQENDNINNIKKSLLPILIQLRKRDIEDKILISLSTIFYYHQNKKTILCQESYYKLSIGDTAWPIGVANVGIHERANIESEQSNIMTNDIRRLWIVSLKSII